MSIIVCTSRYKERHKSEPLGHGSYCFTDDENFFIKLSGKYHNIRSSVVDLYSKELNTRNGILYLLTDSSVKKSSTIATEELEKIRNLL